MRTWLTLVFLFLALPGQSQEEVICKDLAKIVKMEHHFYDDFIAFKSNLLTLNYDLKYHRFEWVIDPGINYISGVVTSYFEPLEKNFQMLHFDLDTNMFVKKISYHGDSIHFKQLKEDILEIELPNGLAEGVLDSVSIYYEGAPESNGFGSFVQSMHDTVPIIRTLSEPYGAKTWWPCKQDLVDKIDSIDVIVKVPKIYSVASNGVLVKEELVDTLTKQFHWRHRYPIPAYLIAIAVTNYSRFSDYVYLENGDSLEILNYIFPEHLAIAENHLKNTIEIMEFFNEKFGVYPFATEKYGHAEFGFGGGMEHQTMSFMGGFSYGLQAHELAHQWFGDKVTCGSWEDIWLNEGFATYLTALTTEFLKSDVEWANWKENTIRSVTNYPGGSVWVDDTTSVARIFNGRLSYQKAALLLHMLRWFMGDDHFFQAIRNYVDDPEVAFGFATTQDLQRHFELQSGLELDEFLNDWFYNQGYPSYHLRWAPASEGIRIRLDQNTSHESVEFFEMPVPIQVIGQERDSIFRLSHQFSGQEFLLALDFEVDTIIIDPERWLISAGNTVEQIVTSINAHGVLELGIQIIPNPVREVLIIYTNRQPGWSKLEIYNMKGQKMFVNDIMESNKAIDVASWPGGTYVIYFWMGNERVVKRFVKQ